jgi:hypothetical protein
MKPELPYLLKQYIIPRIILFHHNRKSGLIHDFHFPSIKDVGSYKNSIALSQSVKLEFNYFSEQYLKIEVYNNFEYSAFYVIIFQ